MDLPLVACYVNCPHLKEAQLSSSSLNDKSDLILLLQWNVLVLDRADIIQ